MGEGAYRAMRNSLKQARVEPDQIQHLNAHATSTQVGDISELNAIKHLFGTNENIAITSTKSATGHLLGGAGGLETIFTVLALRDQIVPATLNLDNPDSVAMGLHLVAKQAEAMKINYALSNGFGFGGVNASILLKRYHNY
ncbi:beta-ketoacyl-[acyl-carrier-protein] synthase family protein [Commensalibacter communis]|uniref:hypothetical protein n=1 Tax=Commensalibacter communis TaxID=2972786 RepID=UPI0038D06A54